jgi:hypothetical protein
MSVGAVAAAVALRGTASKATAFSRTNAKSIRMASSSLLALIAAVIA